jgi:hypothetical protein
MHDTVEQVSRNLPDVLLCDARKKHPYPSLVDIGKAPEPASGAN